jgi:ribosome-associated protein
VDRSSLPAEVKQRLTALRGRPYHGDGDLLIDSREHRTQGQNREAARARLVGLIQQAARRPKKRKATKPGAGAREKRLAQKKRRGAVKQLRGRASDE